MRAVQPQASFFHIANLVPADVWEHDAQSFDVYSNSLLKIAKTMQVVERGIKNITIRLIFTNSGERYLG